MQKILLVEDEDFISDLYKRQLSLSGFEVDVAPTGQQGIDLAIKNKYDIILLDVMLPDINGIKVLEKVRLDSLNKDTLAVFLTNSGQEDIVKEGLKQGAVSYLIKAQYTPDQIVAEVKNILNQSTPPPSA